VPQPTAPPQEKTQNKIGQEASSLATYTMFIPGGLRTFGDKDTEGQTQSFLQTFTPCTNRKQPTER
jgi:hypothetical protein